MERLGGDRMSPGHAVAGRGGHGLDTVQAEAGVEVLAMTAKNKLRALLAQERDLKVALEHRKQA